MLNFVKEAMTDPAELKRRAALHRYEIMDTEPEEDFNRLTRIGAAVFDTPMCAIVLIDEQRVWCKSLFGRGVSEVPRDRSFCTHVIQSPCEVFVVPDARLDPRFSNNPFVTGTPGVRFYAGAPLLSQEGEAVGTFCVVDINHPRDAHMSSSQAHHLQDLARLAVTLMEERLERKMLLETERRLHHAQSELQEKLHKRDQRIAQLETAAGTPL